MSTMTAPYPDLALISTSPVDEELQGATVIDRSDKDGSHYTFVYDYLERLSGKEARQEYYARLEW